MNFAARLAKLEKTQAATAGVCPRCHGAGPRFDIALGMDDMGDLWEVEPEPSNARRRARTTCPRCGAQARNFKAIPLELIDDLEAAAQAIASGATQDRARPE